MLKLVEAAPRVDYLSAYIRMTERWIARNPDEQPCTEAERLQGAFIFVRAVSLIESEDAQTNFELYEAAKIMLSQLTPQQFLTVFPPDKVYDGAKYQCKDYFSTMEAISALPADKPIGGEIDALLWDYMNRDILDLNIRGLCAVSDLHKQQTGREMLQDFFESQGQHLPMYQHVKDPYTDQEYLKAEDGELTPINTKPKLRLVT